MKHLIFTLLVAFAFSALRAQAPQALNYQGVARNQNGNPLANQALALRLSIVSGNANGSIVYAETHNAQTNALGLYNVQIGTGTVQNGNFGLIGWDSNQHFLKVEIDATGGNNFTPIGTPVLLASVPYALEARHAASTTLNGDVTGISAASTVTGLQNRPVNPANPATGDVLKWNGTQWNPAPDATSGGNSYIAGNGITITGQTITATDASNTNELQTLSLSGTQISLSNGGGTVTLPSGSGGDNWGNQTVQTASEFSGNGTASSPLKLAQQGAATGKVLKWNGTAWAPANDLTGSGGLTLPYEGTATDPNAVFQINANGAGAAILGVALGSNSAVQAFNNANGTAAQLAGPGYSAYFNDRVLIETSNPGPELRVYDGGGSGAELQLDNGAHSFNFVASDNYLFLNDNSGQRMSIVDGGDISFATNYMDISSPNGGRIDFNMSQSGAAVNVFYAGAGSSGVSGGGIQGYDPGLGLNASGTSIALVDGEGMQPFEQMFYNMGRYNFRWNTVYAVTLNLSSDRRLKEQINPIKYGLNTVMQMRPVDYFWKDKNIGKTQQMGFIAQELESVMPEAVSHQQMTPAEIEQCKRNGQAVPEITDPYGINYIALTPVLVKAIQEQQALIQQLQQRIEALEKK